MSETTRPTRRDERRVQTVREIKELAMEQVSAGGPDSLTLSGIVRQMSMSPAALYRYFDSRDALLAELVVDAYDDLADFLVAIEKARTSKGDRLDAVLRGTREWALKNPNAYRLIFESTAGSGQGFAAERTIPASARSMTVLVNALAAAPARGVTTGETDPELTGAEITSAVRDWAGRTGLGDVSPEVLTLALLTWTRLHGIVSLELGGHLAATGIGAQVLFDAEVTAIIAQAARARRE